MGSNWQRFQRNQVGFYPVAVAMDLATPASIPTASGSDRSKLRIGRPQLSEFEYRIVATARGSVLSDDVFELSVPTLVLTRKSRVADGSQHSTHQIRFRVEGSA